MKKKLHKSLALVLTVCMMITMLPITALAANEAGSLSVSGGFLDTDYAYNSTSKVLRILSSTPLTISDASSEDMILVETSVTANITLDNVSITTTGTASAAPFSIASGGTVNLTLTGTNELISGADDYAGLNVPEGAELTIDGSGTLNAVGGKVGAGIGGNVAEPAGTITISGGIVTGSCGTESAPGGGGAGIGSGSSATGGRITIMGNADVTAKGGSRAAGIGGGYGGAGGIVIIGEENDNNNDYPIVNASVFDSLEDNQNGQGAGIGSGSIYSSELNGDYDAYDISIHSGTVTAIGGKFKAGGSGGGPGIGGDEGNGTGNREITITGGIINATGEYYGSGIGGNCTDFINSSAIFTISISGGEITATGGSAGIGGNKDADHVRAITISGGDISAEASYIGAGIGGGDNDATSEINIMGTARVLKARGDRGGAGIGGDRNHNGGKISISDNANIGMEIYSYENPGAVGGEGGAGIGGGAGSSGGVINISTTGMVRATGDYGGAGIGGGSNYGTSDAAGSGGAITISNGKIYADGSNMNGGCGAGIGGGGASDSSAQPGGSGGIITISGGTISAKGDTDINAFTGASAAIGGGNEGTGGTITISGGFVETDIKNLGGSMYNGKASAYIGGGSEGGSGSITISGGTVNAWVHVLNAGIYDNDANHIGHGEGYLGSDGSIVISGGDVKAGQANDADSGGAQVRPVPQNSSGVELKRVNAYLDPDGFVSYFDNPQVVSLSIKDSSNANYSYGIHDMYGTNLWLPVGNYTVTATLKDQGDFYPMEGALSVTELLNGRQGTLKATGVQTETISLNLNASLVTYNGNDQMPVFTVNNSSNDTLTEGSDYTVVVTKNGNTVADVINAGPYTITATGKTGTAYEGMNNSKDFHINPKGLTTSYSGIEITKEYDGTTMVKDSNGEDVDSLGLTLSGGVVVGDTITNVVMTNLEYSQSGVGDAVSITGQIDCDGNDDNNYSIALPEDLAGKITAKIIGESNLSQGTLTITKSYDGTISSASAAISGSLALTDLVGQELATVSIDSYGDFNNENVGTDKEVVVTLDSLNGANAANYTLAGGATTFAAVATITPADYSYTVTSPQTDIPQGSDLNGIAVPAGGVGVNSGTVPGTLIWYTNAGRTELATDSYFSNLASGTTVTLYLSFVTTDINYRSQAKTGAVILSIVEGQSQELTFADASAVTKTYGDTSFARVATNSSNAGGAVTYASSNPSAATVNSTSGEVTIIGVGATTITATAASVPGTWARTTTSYGITVDKKAITIVADDKTKTYGMANPGLTFTHTPADLVGSDTVDSLGVMLSCVATTASPAGTPIAITGVSTSTNYNVTVTQGELTITKANQTTPVLALSSTNGIVGLTAPTLSVTGGNGEGTLSYVSSNTSVATVDASTGLITIVTAGAATFTVSKGADTNYNVSSESAGATLTVKDMVGLTVKDTAATEAAIVAHLKNQGQITVGTLTRTGLTNDFTIAVNGKTALTTYASSDALQGEAKWIGLLIGNLQVNHGSVYDIKDLYYKTTEGGNYTQLTSLDESESLQVGGTEKELVLWIKSDVDTTKSIWLATASNGGNGTKLTMNFTPYSTPSSGSGGGGGGSKPTPATPATSDQSGTDKTTVSTTVTATTDATGTASANIPTASVTGLIEKAKEVETQDKRAVIEIKVETDSKAKAAEVNIAKSVFDTISKETNADVKVDTGIGSITFDEKALETISGAGSAENISIRMEALDKNALPESAKDLVGDRPVYDFTVTAGDTKVRSFNGGTASISVPYTLKSGEDKHAVVIYYIDDSGALQTVRGAYNQETGTVEFVVGHFSRYAVGYNKVTFEDVNDNAWYADAVTFLSSRGITTGTSENSFNPNAAITRGEFIVMVMRAYGIEPKENSADNFADAGNAYYKNYLATAKSLGITQGVGDNLYLPNAQISRQDMLTLLYRALKVLEELPVNEGPATAIQFSDASDVASYAKTSVDTLVSAGIVSGSNGKLDPTGKSTRAQMAQILLNLLSE